MRNGSLADRWTRASLAPPRAHGAPLPLVEFKSAAEDFRVEEQLSFVPSGDGPHWLLRVEKKRANTRWVAAELARIAGAAALDVGYAGLKDRHAVTVQWFSVPRRTSEADFWRDQRTEEFRVLEVHANSRKLKRGALTGNRFKIRLRKVAWSREQWECKIASVRSHGVPNYFGPQRFGRGGYNLERVAAWIASGLAPTRGQRGFALSAGRSMIFNALLARRVAAGDWSQLASGDIASLEGSGSHFMVRDVDDELQQRLAAFDIHPSGPLWGRGDPETQGRAGRYESEAAAEFAEVANLLAVQGLVQERRPLRCAVKNLTVEGEPGTLTLGFELGRGQFATAVLRELCEFAAADALESDDE